MTTNGKIYNLVVQHGVIVDDIGYQAMIKSIARKYYAVTNPSAAQLTEAKSVFLKSELGSQILKAIESYNSTSNKSATPTGLGEHWYDETVRTFVIREYDTSKITLPNILVSDKVDYDAAPSQSNQAGSNNFSKGYVAKWYATVYLKDVPTSMKSATLKDVFAPLQDNRAAAVSSGTILADRVYVENADFVIPQATTSDARR